MNFSQSFASATHAFSCRSREGSLHVTVPYFGLMQSKHRAGNPVHTGDMPCCVTPKSIDQLGACKIGHGHDCFLNGVVAYFDWKINKIVREQLLRYNFLNVISSQSLMHSFNEMKAKGYIPQNVACVDDIPMGFAYWISFQTNYRQLKTIYAQRKNHKREEWREFCSVLELLPASHFITGKDRE